MHEITLYLPIENNELHLATGYVFYATYPGVRRRTL